MNPDEKLAELRKLTWNITVTHAWQPDDALKLSELFGELDEHLRAGGELPNDWTPVHDEES